MSEYDALLSQASVLPVAERVRLIEALWETVPEEQIRTDALGRAGIDESS